MFFCSFLFLFRLSEEGRKRHVVNQKKRSVPPSVCVSVEFRSSGGKSFCFFPAESDFLQEKALSFTFLFIQTSGVMIVFICYLTSLLPSVMLHTCPFPLPLPPLHLLTSLNSICSFSPLISPPSLPFLLSRSSFALHYLPPSLPSFLKSLSLHCIFFMFFNKFMYFTSFSHFTCSSFSCSAFTLLHLLSIL